MSNTPRMDASLRDPWNSPYEEGCKLEQELDRVTAERDSFNRIIDTVSSERDQQSNELTALRARVAELERKNDSLFNRCTELERVQKSEHFGEAWSIERQRAESATPAKHPDTDFIDAIDKAGADWDLDWSHCGGWNIWVGNQWAGHPVLKERTPDIRVAIRAAIDNAARKQPSQELFDKLGDDMRHE